MAVSPPRRNLILISSLLFVVVAGIFSTALTDEFITYDDQSYVSQNSHVTAGIKSESAQWAFRTFTQANWHPLTWLSHQLDCQVFGLRSWGHHLTNVLLHGLNTVLVFLLFQKMTGRTWRSLFVASLFGLHPLHVESVAWVAERKDLLSGFFGMLTLWTYARYAQRKLAADEHRTSNLERPKSNLQRRPAHGRKSLEVRSSRFKVRGSASWFSTPSSFYALTLFFFALALLSKPMVVTLPFVLLLLDYWPLGRLQFGAKYLKQDAALLLEKLPFLGLATVSSLLTILAQRSGGMIVKLSELPLVERVSNALISYCRYLGKTFWPYDLAVFYPHPGKWPILYLILSVLLLVAISIIAWAQRRPRPFLVAGWLWFVGMLVPVIGLVHVGWQSMADRYTYLPLLGIFFALAWTAAELAAHRPGLRGAVVALGGLIIVVCAALTHRQLGYWKNSRTLFEHDIAVAGRSYIACANLGNYAAQRGDSDSAIRWYREVVEFAPDAQAHYNLAAILYQKDQLDEALAHFEEAVKENPGYVDGRIGVATVLAAKGRPPEAITQLNAALQLDPNAARAHAVLAYVLAATGQRQEAIAHYRKALELQPGFPGLAEQLQALLASGAGNVRTFSVQPPRGTNGNP